MPILSLHFIAHQKASTMEETLKTPGEHNGSSPGCWLALNTQPLQCLLNIPSDRRAMISRMETLNEPTFGLHSEQADLITVAT